MAAAHTCAVSYLPAPGLQLILTIALMAKARRPRASARDKLDSILKARARSEQDNHP